MKIVPILLATLQIKIRSRTNEMFAKLITEDGLVILSIQLPEGL